jgi:dATP pyrophosphohydrolase
VWLPWKEAAEKCFSWSNRDAILMLPERVKADS